MRRQARVLYTTDKVYAAIKAHDRFMLSASMKSDSHESLSEQLYDVLDTLTPAEYAEFIEWTD